jgi:hypothetical protein
VDYIQFEFPVLGSKILRSTAVLSENLILSGFTVQDEVTAKIVAAIGGDANFRGAAAMRARCFRVVRSVRNARMPRISR